MRKSTRVFKKYIAIFLIVLMSINTLGAVVSDNDGSAFITKAEFDSLKNNFQSQIDQYNTSIDQKIDGAIASYLQGIKVAVSENVSLLVKNYQDIRWLRDLYIYGKYKKWTTNSAYTSQLTNDWFKPSMNEKRMNLRETGIYIYDTFSTAWQMTTNGFYFVATKSEAGITFNGARGYETNPCCPTMAAYMLKDKTGWYVDSYRNFFVLAPYLVSNIHTVNMLAGYQYQIADYVPALRDFRVYTVDDTSTVLKYQIDYNENGNPNKLRSLESVLNIDNCDWPTVWNSLNLWDGDKFSSATKANPNGWGNMLTSDYFNRGCTWHRIDTNAGEQLTVFRYGMFGKDNDILTNVARYDHSQGERGIYDFTGATEYASVYGNFTKCKIQNFGRNLSDFDGESVYTINIPGSFSVQHFPTATLSELSSHNFSYNGNYLNMGQGIPIIIDNSTNNAYLQISFDYDVCNILDNAHSENAIDIDIRNADFLTKDGAYKNGYEGLVSPTSTATSEKTLHNYKIDSASRKAELTVPISIDESIWMRIAPNSTTKGLYAKMSNLSVKIISE